MRHIIRVHNGPNSMLRTPVDVINGESIKQAIITYYKMSGRTKPMKQAKIQNAYNSAMRIAQ